MKKPTRKRRGYDLGGVVDMSLAPRPIQSSPPSSNSMSQGVNSGVNMAMKAFSAYTASKAGAGQTSPKDSGTGSPGVDTAGLRQREQESYRRGGKIKHTSGPRVGKDDGLIPAQRGEYVVRKAAVKKLGTKVLNQVNKGKLPHARSR